MAAPTTMYYKEGTESLKGSPFPPEQWPTAVLSLPARHVYVSPQNDS